MCSSGPLRSHCFENHECGGLNLCVSFGQVGGKLVALKGLEARLKEIHAYLDLVVEGRLPLNHEILYHLQV